MRTYRGLLSALDSPIEETEIADDLPLGVDVVLIQRFEDNSIQVAVLLDNSEHSTLVADEVVDCPHHAEGDQLSTLVDLGDDYADLEADLIEVAALLCDLPEYEEELRRYVIERIAFKHTSCYEGLLTFTFGFHVADVIVQAYQDYEHELGEQLGIPIDPSVESD